MAPGPSDHSGIRGRLLSTCPLAVEGYAVLMDDKAIIRSFESGFNKRIIAMTVLAVVVVVGLLVYVARGFKGQDTSRGAEALTPKTLETNSQPPAKTPPAP